MGYNLVTLLIWLNMENMTVLEALKIMNTASSEFKGTETEWITIYKARQVLLEFITTHTKNDSEVGSTLLNSSEN